MHKKILLWLDRNHTEPFNYKLPAGKALNYLGGNSGNMVFQYALQRILDVPENDITIYTNSMVELPNIDHINKTFDCVVLSPANIISEYAKNEILPLFTAILKKLKIPCYAIGLGAQSDKDYTTEFLECIKEEVCECIDAILSTGGTLGLRGYFTAKCMEILGYREGKDFTVIGCPSMFMNGPNISVEKKKVSRAELKPLVNGFRLWNDLNYRNELYNNYPEAVFVDQEEMYSLLYDTTCIGAKERQYLIQPGIPVADLILNERIRLYGTYSAWYSDIANNNFNFSFGCRIHGNVIPIIAGIPAFIDAFDSRVRELAEYFNIPHKEFDNGFPDLYELYNLTDYNTFNKSFPEKFEVFYQFMHNCGLRINTEKKEIPNCSRPYMTKENIIALKKESLSVKKHTEIWEQEKVIAFVTHEFGHFNGHGGIASCLYQLVKAILDNCPKMQVFVITNQYDSKSDLYNYNNFNEYYIKPDSIEKMGQQVLTYLREIQPHYVETTEYLGLSLESLIFRAREGGELSNTIFFADNHTASRECFEWSTLLPFDLAPVDMRLIKEREHAQMVLVDMNMSPSKFLSDYVTKRYALNPVQTIPHVFNLSYKDKQSLKKEIGIKKDLTIYDKKFVISYISRFEGRKNQIGLVNAFCAFLRRTNVDAVLIMAGNSSYDSITGKDQRQFVFESVPDEFRSKIKFFDFMNKEGKDMIACVTDLAVMSSPYENFPVAMTEYVFQGVPVMTSCYSGCVDFMNETEEYTSFDPFSYGDLSHKIEAFYNLGEAGWHGIALKQLNNIKVLCGLKSAVFDKLRLYFEYSIKLPAPVSNIPIKFIMQEHFELRIKEEMLVDLILHTKNKRGFAGMCIEQFNVVRKLPAQAMVCFAETALYNPIEHLVKDGTVLFPKLRVKESDIGKTWNEFLASEFLKREEFASFIPVESSQYSFDKETFRSFYDIIFRKRNTINLESLYASKK